VGEFGDKFRKAREKKGISLEDVSNVTKISSRNLQAIEQEHFDQLPGGVFNKGFIRAYAKHVGLDDEQAVSEYLACVRQAQMAAQAAWESKEAAAARAKRSPVAANHAPGAKGTALPRASNQQDPAPVEELPGLQLPRPEHVRPPRRQFVVKGDSRIPWRLVAATMVVVVAGFFLWQRHVRGAHAQGAAAPLSSAGSTQSLAAAAPAPGPAVPVAPSVAGAANKTTASKGQKSQPPAQGAKASAPAAPAVAVVNAEEGDATALPSAATSAPAPVTPPPLTLVIRATENSWVSVTADGQVVSQETLIAPAHTSVHASREIVAKIGNAAGVTLVWNGQEIPTEGQEAEVKTYVFDASGMRVMPPPASPAEGR